MKYQILYDDSPEGLSEIVNLAIQQGWKPVGGVSVVRWAVDSRRNDSDVYWEYYQALIKE